MVAARRATETESDQPLARFKAMIDYWPEPQKGDPKWKPWFCNVGDTVEVSVQDRQRISKESIGRWHVVAASSKHFKINDMRVFDQRGWPMVDGPRSNVRARKVDP